MITLAIDTATRTAVALLCDETVLVEYFFNVSVNHSETVLSAVHQGLALAGIGIDGVDLFALTVGPGSFTGLRIGASTVKGLALTTGKARRRRLHAGSALAYNAIECPALICPMLDARKGEVYAALYRANREGLFDVVLEEEVTTPGQFLDRIEGETLFFWGLGSANTPSLSGTGFRDVPGSPHPTGSGCGHPVRPCSA